MRYVSITTSYPRGPNDGSAPFVRAIEQELAHSGNDVVVLLPWREGLEWDGADGEVTIEAYRYAPGVLPCLHVWGYGGAMASDRRLRVAALLVAPIALISALIHTLRLARKQDAEMIHAHWLIPNGPIAAVASIVTGVPLAVSVHGSDVYIAEKGWLLKRLARWVGKRADSITVCSADLKVRLARLGVDEGKLTTVPYGVDTDFFSPMEAAEKARWRTALGYDENDMVIGAVGRLVSKKGFDVLIRAMRELPSHVSLVIAGDGSDETYLRGLALREGLDDRIQFLGSLDREGVRDLIGSVDVLCVPSVIDQDGNVDGLPNVLIEGLSCGAAIVASNVAGIPDVVGHGVNGLLVEPGESRSIAEAIRILDEAPNTGESLGKNARSYAVGNLSWSKVVAMSPYASPRR